MSCLILAPERASPIAGLPIGANDFATEAYSYDETDGDFELKHFSIAHDEKTLVPFIQAALRYQPKLRLWASPWSSAELDEAQSFLCRGQGLSGDEGERNSSRSDRARGRGHVYPGAALLRGLREIFRTLYRCLPREGNSRWHGHAAERIQFGAEFSELHLDAGGAGASSCAIWVRRCRNAAWRYSSARWSAEIRKMLETVMADEDVARFIKGVGTQWAGKNALPAIHRGVSRVADLSVGAGVRRRKQQAGAIRATAGS